MNLPRLEEISELMNQFSLNGGANILRILYNDITDPSPPPDPFAISNTGCNASVLVAGITELNGAELLGVSLRMNFGRYVYLSPYHVDASGNYSLVMGGAWCNDGSCNFPSNHVESTAHWKIGNLYIDEMDDEDFLTLCEDRQVEILSARTPERMKARKQAASTLERPIPDPSAQIGGPAMAPVRVDPDGEAEDGWLHYSNVLVREPHSQGVVLYENDQPLKAQAIQCYADQVSWRHHGDPDQTISRPVGTMKIASPGILLGPIGSKYYRIGCEPFRFPGTSKGAVCILQNGTIDSPKEKFDVVMASSRNQPDTVYLRNEDIIVRVNDSFESTCDFHTGRINLWVKKIIDFPGRENEENEEEESRELPMTFDSNSVELSE